MQSDQRTPVLDSAVTAVLRPSTFHPLGDVSPLTWRERGLVAVILVLVTAGHSIAVPPAVNQHQYLVHALGDTNPDLAGDFLLSTADPYPFFTAVARLVYDSAGLTGIRLLSPAVTFIGLLAVFLLARQLYRGKGLGVPLVAAMLVGFTLSVGILGSFLPYDWSVSAFQGFAGQYLLIKPGYFQPSTTGVLVLLAIPIWLGGMRTVDSRTRRVRVASATALTALAAALAPTYLVVTAVALMAALGADLVTGRGLRRIHLYAIAGVVTLLAGVLANPSLLQIGSSDPALREAMERFAFELFPQHTLFSNWPPDDSSLLLVIAIGAIMAPYVNAGAWLSRWLLLALAIALAAAIAVYFTKNSALAMMFPWRVSVLLVPVASTVIAIWLAEQLKRLPHFSWRWAVVILGLVVAIPGIASSASKQGSAQEDPSYPAVAEARPEGLGLVPLGAGRVRLYASVPLYVDGLYPPYGSSDIVEWWERVDRVRAFEGDPEIFCEGDWAASVDWLELAPTAERPSCLEGWTQLSDVGGYRVIQRP